MILIWISVPKILFADLCGEFIDACLDQKTDENRCLDLAGQIFKPFSALETADSISALAIVKQEFGVALEKAGKALPATTRENFSREFREQYKQRLLNLDVQARALATDAVQQLVEQAQWAREYTKHRKARTINEAKGISLGHAKKAGTGGPYGQAQYLPGLDVQQLERAALNSPRAYARYHKKHSIWKFYRFDHPVGFDEGVETRWIRVELTSGAFHGHPMNIQRVRKYIPDAKP